MPPPAVAKHPLIALIRASSFDNTSSVFDAIDAIPWLDQNTNTSGAIRFMHDTMFTAANGARDGVPWLGIVITDGVSTYDVNLTIPEADVAKNKDIVMFAIGLFMMSSS